MLASFSCLLLALVLLAAPSLSLATFDAAVQTLFDNNDSYLGLGEEERTDPRPFDLSALPPPLTDDAGDAVDPVDIHAAGRFKFVLVEVSVGDQWSYLLRSHHEVDYHADLFEATKREIRARLLKGKVAILGGGRLFRPEGKPGEIFLYGFSATFGRCQPCNEIAAAMIRTSLGLTDEQVTWSNEGY